MTRRWLAAGTVGLLLAGGLSLTVGLGVAGAGKLPAAGNVSCKITGTGKFSPALTFSGSPGGVKFSFKATSADCSSNATAGGVSVSITGVTVTGSGFWNLPTGGPSSACTTLPFDQLGVVRAHAASDCAAMV